MLEFQPENIDSLSKRLSSALGRVWFRTDLDNGKEEDDRPGKHRTHTFDFESGLRLIVSKDRYTFKGKKLEPFIHISASWKSQELIPSSMYEASFMVKEAWKALKGEGMPNLLGLSLGGVLHYRVEINDDIQ